MQIFIDIIKESGTLFLSILVGIVCFRKLNPFFRVLFYQSVMAGIVYVIAYNITDFQRNASASIQNGYLIEVIHLAVVGLLLWLAINHIASSGKRKKLIVLVFIVLFAVFGFLVFIEDWTQQSMSLNQWLYNLSTIAEAIFLLWSFKKLKVSPKMEFFAELVPIILLTALIFQTATSSIYQLANYAILVEAILFTVLFLWYVFYQTTYFSGEWKLTPEFLIIGGMVLYFVGLVPYMSLFDFLNQDHIMLSQRLYYNIVLSLATIRYLLVTYSFWKCFGVEKQVINNE